MATGKMSTGEKKLIKTVLIFILVQIAIVWVFASMCYNSQPIDIKDTKQITIIVDDTLYIGGRGPKFAIYSNGVKYSFDNENTTKNLPNSQLYKNIAVGDRLTIRYYEKWHLHGTKWVVEAKSGSKVYRTLEEYNKRNDGFFVPAVVFFILIEIAFIAICVFCLSLEKNNFKTLVRRIKRKYRRK